MEIKDLTIGNWYTFHSGINHCDYTIKLEKITGNDMWARKYFSSEGDKFPNDYGFFSWRVGVCPADMDVVIEYFPEEISNLNIDYEIY